MRFSTTPLDAQRDAQTGAPVTRRAGAASRKNAPIVPDTEFNITTTTYDNHALVRLIF